MARQFVASNKDRLDFGTPAGLKLARNFSMSAWVKLTSLANFQSILSYNTGGMYLRIDDTNKVNFLCSQTADVVHGSTSLSSGVWHHVAATLDNGSPATAIVYLDGASDGTATTSQDFSGPTGKLQAAVEGSFPLFTEALDGHLAELAVWSGVLTAGEIKSLASGRPADSLSRVPLLYAPISANYAPEPSYTGTSISGVVGGTALTADPPIQIPWSDLWGASFGVLDPAPALPKPTAQNQIGPVVPGEPWYGIELTTPPAPVVAPVPAPPASSVWSGQQAVGPMLPGLPWFSIELTQPPSPAVAPPPAVPPTSPKAMPFISRVPRENEPQRLARITERLTILVNSLVAQGYIVQTGPATFRIKAAGTSGLTGTFP